MTLGCRKFSAVFISVLFFLFSAQVFGARKSKKAQPAPTPIPLPVPKNVTEDEESPSEEDTSASVPEKKQKAFFASVDKNLVQQVQFGSPEKLKAAISVLRKKYDNGSEAEKILLYIAQNILKICWPSEHYSEPLVSVSAANDYVGILESVQQGIFDRNSISTDFFAYALPPLLLAVSDKRTDFYADAGESLQKALEINEKSFFVNYLYALYFEKTSQPANALYYYEKAGELDSCFETSLALARINYQLRNYEKASFLAGALYEADSQNRQVLKICAEIKYAVGDYAACENYVNKVLQMEPENRYFLLFRARLLINKGEYIRAASLLDAYARIDTTSKDYLILRHKVQKEWNKNISAATTTIETAFSYYPEDDDVILLAASLASENGTKIGGMTGDELADLILEKNPQNVRALQIKVASMVQKKNWAEAYAASSALLADSKNRSGNNENYDVPLESLFLHVSICLASGRKDEAWKFASELYSSKSTDEEVVQVYIDVLVSTSRFAEAVKLINQLLPSASTKMKSFLYYEKSYIDAGEAAVLADLRSSLTANPRNKDALFRLYSIYFDKKEYRKAQYYLKQVVALSPNDESLLLLNQKLEQLLK